jgi:rod shape-determining protein MreC
MIVFFSSAANEVTGRINQQYSGVRQYFSLRETNRLLFEENARLKNELQNNYIDTSNTRIQVNDSTVKDSTGNGENILFFRQGLLEIVTLQNNFLTIERGTLQGVRKGMAVASSQGIVGVVVEAGPNISRVMSLLHRNSKVSAMLKKDNVAGSLEWDGADPGLLTLRNIPKSSVIKKGDSVLTSFYSANFPSQLLVGTVAEIRSDSESNFFSLKVKTAVTLLQYSIRLSH